MITGLVAAAAVAGSVVVGPALYRPMFPPSPDEAVVSVPAFLLDETPVTNQQFLEFVVRNPEWRSDQVSRLYADPRYLQRWSGPTTLGSASPPGAPVVHVSWFAARAYCRDHGGQLPTVAQWELAAAADGDTWDARQDPEFVASILGWYAHPTPDTHPDVRRGAPNRWGVYDLHGLVWEWTKDFDSELVAGDARDQGDPDLGLFCGAGTVGATDPANYAAFMRISMRSALRAVHTTSGVGFRCAYPLEES
jgi:sulfatase modifying factor 1